MCTQLVTVAFATHDSSEVLTRNAKCKRMQQRKLQLQVTSAFSGLRFDWHIKDLREMIIKSSWNKHQALSQVIARIYRSADCLLRP